LSFFQDKQEFLSDILGRYPRERRRSAVMPLLRRVQTDEGYVSEARITEIAEIIGSTSTEVKSVMSFYSAYTDVPTGTYHLQVCMTLSCALAGSDRMWDYLTETLGIGQGEVTPDGLFSLQRVECLGSCGTAPMLQVSDHGYHECLTRARLDALLQDLRARGGRDFAPNDTPPPVAIAVANGVAGQRAADGRLAAPEAAPPPAPPAAPEGGPA
jgi:NADH-quinone oxidoreductase subunit E